MRRGTMRMAAVLGGGLLMGGAGLALAVTPAQVIKERRAGFKHMGENFKAMKQAIDAGADVTPMAARAAEIEAWAKKFPGMFPPGTETGGGTHARPAVWSDRPGFEKHNMELQQAAAKLQQAAQSGHKAAFAAQWKATGKVCGGCHETYRYKLS